MFGSLRDKFETRRGGIDELIESPRPLLPRLRPKRRRPRGPLALLGALDQKLLVAIRTTGHTKANERFFGALGTFGEWGLGWLVLGFAGSSVDPQRRHGWMTAASVGPAAVTVNYAIKVAVGRERPLIDEHPRLARAPSKLSFPSAHSTSSVAAATALARIAPTTGPVVYPLAAAVCFGRPFLGMHYPSDVIAGAALGRVIGRAWPLPDQPPRRHWADGDPS